MKVTRVELIQSTKPITFPKPWAPAWNLPSGKPTMGFDFSFYKLYTDSGLVGIGPFTGAKPEMALGFDPTRVGAFWYQNMSGVRHDTWNKGAAGLEIAMWDIIGKAANMPLYQIFGSSRNRMPVYAAISQLPEVNQQIEQVEEIIAAGFKAIKLRMHRQNPWDDLEVFKKVNEAVAGRVMLLVDGNQNNYIDGYNFWSRPTALKMAQELDALGVYYLEDPLPGKDMEGLVAISNSVNMYIAGGEHSSTVYDFKPHLLAGAYDIIQPDVSMMGNMGITGLRHVSAFADQVGRLVIPHVLGRGETALHLAATLPAMAAAHNCPWAEYPCDPPVLTPQTLQAFVTNPILIESDGCVALPSKPGLGLDLDEDWLKSRSVVSETVKL